MGSSFSEIFGRNKKCLTRHYITQQGILYLANIIRKTILACQQGPIITFSIQARKKNAENLMILPYKNTFVKKKINISM